MHVFERQHYRLRPRACHHPIGQCGQLPAPQFLRRQTRRTFRRQRNIEQRREQRGVLRRVELDLRQRVLQVREALLRRHVGAAETLAAPFGDRMQRRVLQKLRAAPFDPGVRRVAQPGMKFFDQARLPSPGSPTISTSWPSPCRARSQRRISIAISSSRPTSGVRWRCPARRPPPLARTSRNKVTAPARP